MILLKIICASACFCTLFSASLFTPFPCQAEDYSFNVEEFEKKNFELAGYTELRWDHNRINRDGAFGLLGFYNNPPSDLDCLTATLQLDGNHKNGILDFNWRLQASGRKDQVDSGEDLDIFSAYASIKPSPSVTIELGKKTFKWGKGYAWNPVAFIDRPKDPNNPEDALEGFISAGFDVIKSFPRALQTLALTGVIIPVWDNFNNDFSVKNSVNLAAKLYLLYQNTDIDFILFTGNSRSTRYGFDFSKNLASNFEIHGELAHIPDHKVQVLSSTGMLKNHNRSITSYLLGLRYLTENELTTTLEFYHNDAGYSEAEIDHFYQLVSDSSAQYSNTNANNFLVPAASISDSGYAKPQIRRNYIYIRMTQKEPFEVLYFTPGITAIINLNDKSYSLSPEAIYSGFTNWQLRLRYSRIDGGRFTEYGEKLNESKLELRVRYYF